jgi:hypothetical protein
LTVGKCAVLLYLKLYLLFFKVTRSCRYRGVSLFIILNVSIAIVRIRLIFRVRFLILDLKGKNRITKKDVFQHEIINMITIDNLKFVSKYFVAVFCVVK